MAQHQWQTGESIGGGCADDRGLQKPRALVLSALGLMLVYGACTPNAAKPRPPASTPNPHSEPPSDVEAGLAPHSAASASVAASGSPQEPPPPGRLAPAEERELRSWLREQAVGVRAKSLTWLYTWTTAEQVAELKDGKPLLSRERNVRGKLSPFDEGLETYRKQGEPFARLFRSQAMRKRRFGWSNPWAIRRTYAGGEYGNQLLALRLRADAIIAIFQPQKSRPFDFVDTSGKRVSRTQARRQAHRLGVVLHVPNPYHLPLREYIICNPVMVEEVVVNPADSKPQLAKARRGLALLQRAVEADSRLHTRKSLLDSRETRGLSGFRHTVAPNAKANLVQLYSSALAFASEPYLLQARNLLALQELLHLPKRGLSFRARPKVRRRALAVGPDPKGRQCRYRWCGYRPRFRLDV